MQTIDEALQKLQTSPFRARFRLGERDRAYVRAKGLPVIRRHARDFVRDFNSGADPLRSIASQVAKFWQKQHCRLQPLKKTVPEPVLPLMQGSSQKWRAALAA